MCRCYSNPVVAEVLHGPVAVPAGFEGYTPGKPGWIRPAILAIDAGAVACLKCPQCKRRGLTCEFYFRRSPRSYRIRAACRCGYWEEC